jgi:hypothetical protein
MYFILCKNTNNSLKINCIFLFINYIIHTFNTQIIICVYRAFLPCIILSMIAISAITSKMWMIPPALYAKKPTAQMIITITAIK